MFIFGWLFSRPPQDNREDPIRNAQGQALALRVTGPERIPGTGDFDTPAHEAYIHDGTPHQNPAVVARWAWQWWMLIPVPVRVQDRYYPLTQGADGRVPDLNAIEQRTRRRVRRGQAVAIAPMDATTERRAHRREDRTQRQRGVPRRRLKRYAPYAAQAPQGRYRRRR